MALCSYPVSVYCNSMRKVWSASCVSVCHTSQVKGHRSHVTGHTSQVTRHRPQATSHRSYVTRHRSKITGHRPHVTGHTSQVTRQQICLWETLNVLFKSESLKQLTNNGDDSSARFEPSASRRHVRFLDTWSDDTELVESEWCHMKTEQFNDDCFSFLSCT